MLNLNEYFTEDTENFVKNRVEYRLKEKGQRKAKSKKYISSILIFSSSYD